MEQPKRQERPQAVRVRIPDELFEHAIIIGFAAAAGLTATYDGMQALRAIDRSVPLGDRAAKCILRHLYHQMHGNEAPNQADFDAMMAELTALPKES